MKYRLDFSPKFDFSAPSVTGAPDVGVLHTPRFIAWQPSTWPVAPALVNEQFVETLHRIFQESILAEINNVIADSHAQNGDLQHRGHVVAIAILCALDAISSYGYGARCGRQIPDFVKAHFPDQYHDHGKTLLKLYRHAMIHGWNLVEVSIYPGNERITKVAAGTSVGLLNLFSALVGATEDFLERLAGDPKLHKNTLRRYNELQQSARP